MDQHSALETTRDQGPVGTVNALRAGRLQRPRHTPANRQTYVVLALPPLVWTTGRIRGGPVAGEAGRPALAGAGGELGHQGQRRRVLLARPDADHPGRLGLPHPVLAALGADHGQGPAVALADAAGGDVGVLGREVGAELAALAGGLLHLLEGDLDLLAGRAAPELEPALDVDLGDVVQRDPVVLGDHLAHAVVGERLGTEQPEGDLDPARVLVDPPCLEGAVDRGLAAHADQGQALEPAPLGLLHGQGVGGVGVAGTGSLEHLLAGGGQERLAVPQPGRRQARGQGALDPARLQPHSSRAVTSPPSWPASSTAGSAALARNTPAGCR